MQGTNLHNGAVYNGSINITAAIQHVENLSVVVIYQFQCSTDFFYVCYIVFMN